MKRRIHLLAALASLFLWGAMIAAMVVNQAFWFEALPFVLLASVATMVGTVLVSRYWIRRDSIPSYGSIFLVSFACACLASVVCLFCEAYRYGEWYLFSLSYWDQAKGGYAELILPFLVFWFVSWLPAAAIVIYFQKPHDSAQTQLGSQGVRRVLET